MELLLCAKVLGRFSSHSFNYHLELASKILVYRLRNWDSECQKVSDPRFKPFVSNSSKHALLPTSWCFFQDWCEGWKSHMHIWHTVLWNKCLQWTLNNKRLLLFLLFHTFSKWFITGPVLLLEKSFYRMSAFQYQITLWQLTACIQNKRGQPNLL